MEEFNLEYGLYCVQSGVILTKFGHRFIYLSVQPNKTLKSLKKLLGHSALCI